VFNRLYSWVADAAAGIDISSSRTDADTNDLTSNGFGNCLTRDGQGAATANLPMLGFRHTGVGNGQAATDYAALGQLQSGTGVNWTIGGGTANAITATYTPALASLVDGQLCFVRATAANTTSTPTFNPNALGANTITKNGGAALAAGDIPGNLAELILRYNLANTRWELLNDGTAVATNWVAAGGSADAITATYAPAILALTDGLLCYFRAGAANATTTPTFAPSGLTAHTITKNGGAALGAGDIPAAAAECIVRYNLANTRWELLNPAAENAVSSTIAVASAVSLSNGSSKNVTSISIPPGDWDVSGCVAFAGTSTTNVTQCIASISATTGTTTGLPNGSEVQQGYAAFTPFLSVAYIGVNVGPLRVSISTTTTYYLVGTSAFTASTNTAFGYILARRRA
jgi:hypothetical protein